MAECNMITNKQSGGLLSSNVFPSVGLHFVGGEC